MTSQWNVSLTPDEFTIFDIDLKKWGYSSRSEFVRAMHKREVAERKGKKSKDGDQ